MSVSKMRIDIIDPSTKRGTPPRNLTHRDVIKAPIDYTRGEWRMVDLLDNRSAISIMRLYNQLEKQNVR